MCSVDPWLNLGINWLAIIGIQYFVQRINKLNIPMVAHFSLLSSRLNCCFLSSPSILRCTVFRSIFLSVDCSHFVCVRAWECGACVCCRVVLQASPIPFCSADWFPCVDTESNQHWRMEWRQLVRWVVEEGVLQCSFTWKEIFYQLQLLSEDLSGSYYKLTNVRRLYDKNEI